jgi:sialate O-acetylesterase
VTRLRQPLLGIATILISLTALHGEVKLPALVSDHMVVQRDLPVHIWGMAEAGERVSVSFRGEEKVTAADALGH